MSEGKIFEILFIRHGESCANALHKSKSYLQKASHASYNDPELTSRGILESEQRGDLFLKPVLSGSQGFYPQIETTEEGKPLHRAMFTLGSSPLLRAQETAYLMVGKPWKKKIFLMPHIGETGKLGSFTRDNNPDPFGYQTAYMQTRHGEPGQPGQTLLYLDTSKVEAAVEPNFPLFQEWIKTHPNYFTKGLDGVYRAVIVSHSNSLRKAFPFAECVNPPKGIPEKDQPSWKLSNNDFLVSVFDFREEKPEGEVPGRFLNPEAIYPKWMYFNTQAYQSGDAVPCGRNAKCGSFVTDKIKKGYYAPHFRTNVPVSGCASGGYRKTKKVKKSRRRHTRRR